MAPRNIGAGDSVRSSPPLYRRRPAAGIVLTLNMNKIVRTAGRPSLENTSAVPVSIGRRCARRRYEHLVLAAVERKLRSNINFAFTQHVEASESFRSIATERPAWSE